MSNIKVYRRQGGSEQVIANGGKLVVQTGGKIVPNSETQAAHITDVSTATIAWTTGDKAKVNTVLAALEGVGVLATS
jgi:hypothetical protein